MKPHEAEAVLHRINYKPGWQLQWDFRRGGFVTGRDALIIRWTFQATDAYDHSKVGTFATTAAIPHLRHLDEEGLVREVHRITVQAELHEANEFFMYGNERPFDPHAGEQA